MKVFTLEHMDFDGLQGVFHDRESALNLITGEEEDYERMSDTEEYFETSYGQWVVTEWVVQ